MEKLYQIVKLLAVASVIPVAVCLCMFLLSLKAATEKTVAIAQALPAQVDARLGKIQDNVLAKIDTVQDKLSKDVIALTNTGDRRLASIQAQTFEQVQGIRQDFNTQLTQTNQTVSMLANSYAGIPNTIAARLDKYTDCEKNDLCWQGQFTDSLFALRTTSRDVSMTMQGINGTLPGIEGNVAKISETFATGFPIITTNVEGISKNINTITHPHWYDRLLGYALNGAILYRSLNPASLSVTAAATVVASH
jgi:ElaB/YqjD/DUF883 family membrane-anchored ribosome-binding protein